MNCPVDNTTLVMSDRNGIEIDYCPQCRGVWLDRGELDKIIERGSAAPSVQSPPPTRHDSHYSTDSHHRGGHHHHKKRKESFLGELFDF